MADVGGEPLLSLDALLELVDHGVEGAGEADQVGVVDGSRQPGVELAAGDGHGRRRHTGQGAQGTSGGRAPDRRAEHGRDEPGGEEGQGEDSQGVAQVVQVEHLEVGDVDRRDRDADDELRVAVQLEGLGGRRSREHQVAQGVGEGPLADRDRPHVPLVVGAQVEEGVGAGRARVGRGQEGHDAAGAVQCGPDQFGVEVRLVDRGVLALVDQEVPDGEVREAAHRDRQDQRPQAEQEGHPGAQPEAGPQPVPAGGGGPVVSGPVLTGPRRAGGLPGSTGHREHVRGPACSPSRGP